MGNPRAARTYSAFEIDGQRYERIAETAHKTQRGSICIITTYAAHCADCGEEFFLTSTQRPGPTHPARRCKACVRPGFKPVVRTLATPKPKAPRTEPIEPVITPTDMRRQIRMERDTPTQTPTAVYGNLASTQKKKPGVFADR